jgi:hypothetical protein
VPQVGEKASKAISDHRAEERGLVGIAGKVLEEAIAKEVSCGGTPPDYWARV